MWKVIWIKIWKGSFFILFDIASPENVNVEESIMMTKSLIMGNIEEWVDKRKCWYRLWLFSYIKKEMKISKCTYIRCLSIIEGVCKEDNLKVKSNQITSIKDTKCWNKRINDFFKSCQGESIQNLSLLQGYIVHELHVSYN